MSGRGRLVFVVEKRRRLLKLSSDVGPSGPDASISRCSSASGPKGPTFVIVIVVILSAVLGFEKGPTYSILPVKCGGKQVIKQNNRQYSTEKKSTYDREYEQFGNVTL